MKSKKTQTNRLKEILCKYKIYMTYVIKHNSTNNCFQMHEDKNYYRIFSGSIYFFSCDDFNYSSHNVYIQRLKWEFVETELVPLNNFEKKQFFHVDRYKLVDDVSCEPFKFKPYLKHDGLFSQSKAEKLVKYRFTKDRHKNFDNEKDCIINLD